MDNKNCKKKNCKLNNNDSYKRIFQNANKISRIPKYFKKSVTHNVTKCLKKKMFVNKK